jgi:uncharacterized protein YprB with RNaseH-like and TPR domain/predicted nuclease with RNAse H fold
VPTAVAPLLGTPPSRSVADRRAAGRVEDRFGLLPETFVHIAGIGRKTEWRLWQSGVATWDDLRTTSFGFRPGVLEALEDSAQALQDEDVDYFFSALPPRDRWRTFSDFGRRFVAVDIETTGMSVYDQVTVIGIEHEGVYRTFLRGSNLEEAAELINDADGLITFNGTLFDLPFIRRTFPEVELPVAHVDLRFLSRRVGWAGSLKTVEQLAALRRADGLADISGYGATVLWSCFDHDGDQAALEKLVLYNAADTCVLRPLAELVTDRLLDDLRAQHGVETHPSLFAPTRVPKKRVPFRPDLLAPLPEVGHGPRGLRVGTVTVKMPARRGVAPEVTLSALHQRMPDAEARIVGIDLTGSEKRPTGWALLEGRLTVTGLVHTDEELLSQTIACRPRIVSIDSPLSIPLGRHCTDDGCECRKVGGITRHCERELKRRGVNVYPCLIQSMQKLTLRGMRLAAALREAGLEVIESYPGAAQDMMRIPRKRASQERLRAGLVRFGVRGIRAPDLVTHDELDAITSAVVGAFYLADAYEPMGTREEDYLIVPQVTDELRARVDETAPEEPAVLVVIGEDAAKAADGLGYACVDRTAALSAPETLVALASAAEYQELLAELGARTRGFYVAPLGSRVRRRPSFFDGHRRCDAPDVQEALAAWVADWSSAQPCH